MEHFITLLKRGCFSRADAFAIVGNVHTADSLLYYYKKKGYIQSVRRDLYVAISPETGLPVRTPYQIASHISSDACVSHHSAFEVHGMANQVFSDLYVCSGAAFRGFDFDGKRYKRVAPLTNEGVVTVGGVRVTDVERTIIDSVKDFAKIGGLEELLHCLSVVTYADADKLIKYLNIYQNCFLWQKTGYLLLHFANMKLPSSFFDLCLQNARGNVRYLYEELKNEDPVYVKEWKLYVPRGILKMLDEGGEPLV